MASKDDPKQLRALQNIVLALMRLQSISDEILRTVWSSFLVVFDEGVVSFKSSDPSKINQALVTSATLNGKVLELLTKMFTSLTAARREQILFHSSFSDEMRASLISAPFDPKRLFGHEVVRSAIPKQK